MHLTFLNRNERPILAARFTVPRESPGSVRGQPNSRARSPNTLPCRREKPGKAIDKAPRIQRPAMRKSSGDRRSASSILRRESRKIGTLLYAPSPTFNRREPRRNLCFIREVTSRLIYFPVRDMSLQQRKRNWT